MDRLLQILVLAVTAVIFTASMSCDKMISNNSPTANNGATNDVFEMGRYQIRTTRRIRSDLVKDLMSTLHGASEIVQLRGRSFTAVLQPRDLKKLCRDELVRSIKEVEKMNTTKTCDKLISGVPRYVISNSYIVMIKQHNNMSELMPLIITASNDLDSSVMIASVRQFQNPNRRGATMRMNTEGLHFMCNQSVIDYIEEDQEVTNASTTPPWHLDRIDQFDLPLDGEYTSPNNGSGVDIYVFDTGINRDHEEFEGRARYDLYDPVDVNSMTNQQGRDCNGHGTHVAALVAGKTYGVAKGATVYSMRVLSCSGTGSFVNVLLGINHVIEQQILNRTRRIIINMSLRGPISQAVDDAISDATEQGILVVVAAGNDFQDACRYSPGSSSNALTVGGTQRNDYLYLRLFDGTNYGRCVDVFAPGQDILSAGIRSNNAVEIMSGTSQAAPIVSGAAAIYWNMNKTATPLEIKDTITSTCTRDHLRISTAVPSAFAEQSPNCLLHMEFISTPSGSDNNSLHYIYHSVPSSEVVHYIEDMENRSYALTFIHNHEINSAIHYSLIFKYMPSIDFLTLFTPRQRQMIIEVDNKEQIGYQVTLLYNSRDIDFVAVLEKTNLSYSHVYRLPMKQHSNMYQSRSLQNDSLLSTAVRMTNGGAESIARYSSVYLHDNDAMVTHHFPNISASELLEIIDVQLNQTFYLSHLTTIPTSPPSYSVVFRKMAESPENYVMSKDLELDEVKAFVQMQINKRLTPLVTAGIETPNGLKFIVSLKK